MYSNHKPSLPEIGCAHDGLEMVVEKTSSTSLRLARPFDRAVDLQLALAAPATRRVSRRDLRNVVRSVDLTADSLRVAVPSYYLARKQSEGKRAPRELARWQRGDPIR